MNNLISQTPKKKFLLLSGVFCFIGDLVLAAYIFTIFADPQKFNQILSQSSMFLGQPIHIDQDLLAAQFIILANTVKMMLLGFLSIHALVYLAHIKDKPAATKYIIFSLYLTLPTSFLFIFEAWPEHKFYALLFLLQIPLYLYSFQGIRYWLKERN